LLLSVSIFIFFSVTNSFRVMVLLCPFFAAPFPAVLLRKSSLSRLFLE
jgi:hypothetical protein